MNKVHTKNRDLKAERDLYFRFHQRVEGKNREIDGELERLKGEANGLVVYKEENEKRMEMMGQKLKQAERELDVSNNQYRIYEEKYITTQKEFTAAQS